MILSCSRRTDIPAFYSTWLMNRLKEGYVCVANPFNSNQVSRIPLTKDNVDCIVFWTKDPRPLIPYLGRIDALGFNYIFQWTITPYFSDIEPGIQDKKEIVEAFIQLSKRIGKDKMILRYDPILLSSRYDLAFHKKAFKTLLDKTGRYAGKVVISFLDLYRKNEKRLNDRDIRGVSDKERLVLAKGIKEEAQAYDLRVETCAEAADLSSVGIHHGKCIEGNMIESIFGVTLKDKDKREAGRTLCGCMKSIDIGQYDTCGHGCLYCYANNHETVIQRNISAHHPESPILIGSINERKVTERKDVSSLKEQEDAGQLSIDDWS